MIIDFVKKEDQTYKTKPRFHERRITGRGLCIWQMNKMLRGTGYKIQRLLAVSYTHLTLPTKRIV